MHVELWWIIELTIGAGINFQMNCNICELLLHVVVVLKFTGELLIEELLQQGQCQMLDLIDKVKSRLDEAYNGSYHRFSVLKVVTQKSILKW